MTRNPQFDFQRHVLWGDRLRVFLNSDHVSYGEIAEVLKEKGIFVGSTEKSVLVPLLSATLLTPEQFSRLVSESYTRESIEKTKTYSLPLLKDDGKWIEIARKSFDDIIERVPLDFGIEFEQMPSLTSDPDGSMEISYRLRRSDFSKDWIERELVFEGGLTIRHVSGTLILELNSTHTSKDTDRINGILVRNLTSTWKNQGITNASDATLIRFQDFTNTSRVKFFMALTSGSSSLKFSQVSDIEILRDKTAGKLPTDEKISWMEGTVRRIKIDGDKLNDIFFLSDDRYYAFYHLMKMNADYEFKSGAIQGNVTVSFCFFVKAKNGDYLNSEFNFSIEKMSGFDRGVEQSARKSINRLLGDLRDTAKKKALQLSVATPPVSAPA